MGVPGRVQSQTSVSETNERIQSAYIHNLISVILNWNSARSTQQWQEQRQQFSISRGSRGVAHEAINNGV